MNRLWASSAFCALTALSVATTATAQETLNIPQLQGEAKTVIKALAGQLGGELKAAVKAGGPVAAIQVCNTKAAPITAQVSQQEGWTVSRTSLKLRNPNNAPDKWEQRVLEQFASQAAAGANLKKLAFSQVVVNDEGQKVFRMMKAIPVGQQCLGCHGSKIKPALAEKLDALYPQDQARGFNAGDLRGAFSLQKVLVNL
ncbi:MAG: DUF3365 domain-containing protein [Marinobacterium sp.]|nr:DUF3365 domain-containing protein [Marinobacterium sp.]